MRILYVTNGFPFPLTSGYLRHYFLLRELARSHALTLLSLVPADFDRAHEAALEPFAERIATVASARRSPSARRRLARRAGALVGREPGAAELAATAAALHGERAFDAVVLSGKRTLSALAGLEGVPLVVDICDVTSERTRARLREAGPARALALLPALHRARRVERRLVGLADHLVFASARDRAFLADRCAVPADVVPNGVDLDYWRRSEPRLGAGRVVLTGAMDYQPNEDAAVELAARIMPLVRRELPDATCAIVGRDPTPRVAALAGPGVEVTGTVPDVRPHLERAAVFAAPLRFAAGIQNKVLEALAMEVPVVASPVAADGLRTEAGEAPPLARVAGRAAFAAELVRLLRRVEDDPSPHGEGRRWVAERYDWAAAGRRLDAAVASACARRAAASGAVRGGRRPPRPSAPPRPTT